ncbi:MAG: TetR family transcriptional regulator [Actinomycetota bacterium]|nr:TetR family transcriptional regulator [Actinomycetota bacterium]
MGDVAVGARATRRESTLYGIERVALGLFLERGFDVVTAEQIASSAGISVRTFYRYFPEGKEGVLLLETRRGFDLFLQALRARPPQERADVAVAGAALESVRLLYHPADPELAIGLLEARALYRHIESSNSALAARLIGERVLMLEPLVDLVALRMSVDPLVDPRPRLLVHVADAAITAAWFTAQRNPSLDPIASLAQQLDVLARGFAAA